MKVEGSNRKPDLSPEVPADLTPEQGIALWVEVMNASEAFLLAGLRREIGPDGDLQAAHRRWYEQQMEEHDRMLFRMAERLSRAGKGKSG